MKSIVLGALGALVLSQSPVFAQMGPDIFVYEEVTGNLPGPFTIGGIPYGLWSLLNYGGRWGTGNGDDDDPPPHPCATALNAAGEWDEILMQPQIGASEFETFPMKGRWGNYFAASWVVTRDGGSWRNPRMTAQMNNGSWRNFNSTSIQDYGLTTVLIGDLATDPLPDGTLTMKAELEIRCGAQTPFIVSETYTIPMADPHQEHLHPPASTETTYIPQGVVHHKVNPGAYYWPTPTAYTNLAIFDQGDSDLTQQEVIEQANSFYGLTLEIAAVVESGFEVYLPSGTYDLELLYGWDHYSFETTRPNWLGDPEHFATVEYSSPLINFSTAPY